ncbi:Uncharacterised protein [Mycobacteroides abscessus subsp. abscessus]|nr:Uncharacterised protein [Mycobacteroides abscessus subsp. abscessus]
MAPPPNTRPEAIAAEAPSPATTFFHRIPLQFEPVPHAGADPDKFALIMLNPADVASVHAR